MSAALTILLLLGLAAVPLHARQSMPPAPQAEPVEVGTHSRDQFNGVWDYNATESINILTGRPEQAPRSAAQRGRGAAGGSGNSPVRDRAASRGTGQVGPTPEMARETQDMSRDLLEVPETLTIEIAPTAVSITDDLERQRTFSTDGRKQKYRLASAQFEAKAQWQGTQLRKDVEGNYGFKMSETYFLSADAQRLFVIVRVGQPRKDQAQLGFNRVYDRVDR